MKGWKQTSRGLGVGRRRRRRDEVLAVASSIVGWRRSAHARGAETFGHCMTCPSARLTFNLLPFCPQLSACDDVAGVSLTVQSGSCVYRCRQDPGFYVSLIKS